MLRLNVPYYRFISAEFNLQGRDEPEDDNRFADLILTFDFQDSLLTATVVAQRLGQAHDRSSDAPG